MYLVIGDDEARSLPAWGVWIEISAEWYALRCIARRSPHGECGLKSAGGSLGHTLGESLPAWGVWIEISVSAASLTPRMVSLPAWGVWIEIPSPRVKIQTRYRRSPHGECGLKLTREEAEAALRRSLPAWGVWIEITGIRRQMIDATRRSPHGECGLKLQE